MDATIETESGPDEAFRGRVLVVDDEPLIRWAISTALTDAKYEVIEARDGATANRKSVSLQPLDCALLDLRLPDTDGVTLLKQLRRAHPQCRFMLMTACRTSSLMQVPNVPVIDKPFHIDDVIACVNQAIAAAA